MLTVIETKPKKKPLGLVVHKKEPLAIAELKK